MDKQNLADVYNKLKDNIYSMLVSNDDQELRAMYSFAIDRLETIFFARHKELLVERIKKDTIEIAKGCTNSLYGISGVIYTDTDSIKVSGGIYTDTDSIKVEKEDKQCDN